MSTILTLTTDFGQRDAYVAAMKGTILSINDDVYLVDITHEIDAQDVMGAAFVLREAVPYFPPETVHLVVVDPGVGTKRRAVALRWQEQWFVGPDNGLFALLLEGDQPEMLVSLDNPAFWRSEILSDTFHGRDLFAPVAAHLAAGQSLTEMGTPIDSLRRMHWALPIADTQGIRGWVVHVDHFGNAITNIAREHLDVERLDAKREGWRLKCYAGNAIIDTLQRTYGAVEPGEPLLLFGSSGYLEIAVNNGNAADLLDIHKGTPVNIIFSQ